MSNLSAIGTSALLAMQQQLATTSHNIANATRPGYSRQSVAMISRTPDLAVGGYIGRGVGVVGISRSYDDFLAREIRGHESLTNELAAGEAILAQIGDAIGDADIGLSAALDSLFGAVSDLANDPASQANREVVIGRIDAVLDRFHGMAGFLDDLSADVNQDIGSSVTRINDLAGNLATTNAAILVAAGVGGGQMPNDILDQRDALLSELSGMIDIMVVPNQNGTVEVFVGSGQALVLGGSSTLLSTRADPFDADRLRVIHNGVSDITDQVSGGTLGGLIQARSRYIDETTNEIGRIAYVLADAFNMVHRQGMDRDGDLGVDLFKLPNPNVSDGTNSGNLIVSVSILDASLLTSSDYQMSMDGAGDFIVTRLSDNNSQNMGPGPGPFAIDGLSINLVSGSGVAGDSFLIRPTLDMAARIDRAVLNGDALAAAAPMVTGSGAGNSGDAIISSGTVVDIGNPAFSTTPRALSPPVAIRFLDSNNYEVLDNTNPAAPVILETPIPYIQGGEVFPTPGALDFGYRIQIDGTGQTGDLFQIDYNSGGVGDNRNALALADLQRTPLLSGGNATLQEAYSSLVGAVGSSAQNSRATLEASEILLDHARNRRDSLAGVNLDEEASDLLRFQQAYEAAARTIRVADDIFQALLNATS